MFRVNIISSDQMLLFEAKSVILPLVDGYPRWTWGWLP